MAMTEFRKIQIEQRKLEEELDKIAEKKSEERRKKFKKSYPIHTPKEALRNLGNRIIPKCWYDE